MLVAIVVRDSTGGPGLEKLRTYCKLKDAPCLLTPEGAIIFISCPDIPAGTPGRLVSNNRVPGVSAECLIGKRAAELWNWAQQFGNNASN